MKFSIVYWILLYLYHKFNSLFLSPSRSHSHSNSNVEMLYFFLFHSNYKEKWSISTKKSSHKTLTCKKSVQIPDHSGGSLKEICQRRSVNHCEKKLIWKWKQTWLNVAWVLWFDVCTSRCLINIVYSSNERVIIFLSIFLFPVFYAHIKCLGSLFTFYTGRLFWNCNIKPVWGIFSIQMIFFWHFTQRWFHINWNFFCSYGLQIGWNVAHISSPKLSHTKS